jgi:hypothetical protein
MSAFDRFITFFCVYGRNFTVILPLFYGKNYDLVPFALPTRYRTVTVTGRYRYRYWPLPLPLLTVSSAFIANSNLFIIAVFNI